MGLFSFLKKDKSIQSGKNRTLESEVNKLYNLKKYDEVISLTLPLFTSEQEMSFSIMQKVALSYCYKKDYENSLPLFKKIAEKKNDIESWFNVLTSLMSSNKTQQGEEVFNKMLKMHKGINNQQPRELAIPFIRFYYACGLNDNGLYNDALGQLTELKAIYMELIITDDTFLYIRGIPFLSSTLELAKKVFVGLGIDFANSDFLKDLEKRVDDYGKAIIKKYRG